MMNTTQVPSRERLLHFLYEAAELEHNLMCTYLYAAFALRQGAEEGLNPAESAAVARWRRTILDVANGEMGHLVAVWNITSALGGAPRFGRGNFPLDPGVLPAGVVVKLAPFSAASLQHFIHLERPEGSSEPDGEGFAPGWEFTRGVMQPRLTPMAADYRTVGEFYARLDEDLRAFVSVHGEAATFCGDPALQLSAEEAALNGVKPVICAQTALAAFRAIVEQGEGAPANSAGSHFQLFMSIRDELAALTAANPHFRPALPAAHNPVLRPPVRPAGRVWIENEDAAVAVDLANSAYALMMRLIAFAYAVPRPAPEKALAVNLAVGLMRAMVPLGERAARLPAGPSNPECNAGVSFTVLRDAAALPVGPSAHRYFIERLAELAAAADRHADVDARMHAAARLFADLSRRGERGFGVAEGQSTRSPVTRSVPPTPSAASAPSTALGPPPAPVSVDGVDEIAGEKLTLIYEGAKCIHSRHCVTGAPQVFMANVQGPWIRPDAVDAEALVAIAHACLSGAIRYRRKDGRPQESAPPVNLLAIREAGPYAARGDLRVDGEAVGFRVTLCRCGASKHKPFCDNSHHEVGFDATGEPPTGKADMPAVRDGVLAIDPQLDGPLQVRGNLEIVSGTGRVVARVTSAKLCRCGSSANKPYCDGTHARIGFRSA